MDKEQIEKLIMGSIFELLKNDLDLLKRDCNERSITHKLAEYLNIGLPVYIDQKENYKVDCEYNRNGSLPKKFFGLIKEIESSDLNGMTVYPDIIIHKRGSGDNNNLLVVEAKKFSNCTPDNREYDIKKLCLYKEEYKYQFAYFIKFPNPQKPNKIGTDTLTMV